MQETALLHSLELVNQYQIIPEMISIRRNKIDAVSPRLCQALNPWLSTGVLKMKSAAAAHIVLQRGRMATLTPYSVRIDRANSCAHYIRNTHIHWDMDTPVDIFGVPCWRFLAHIKGRS